MELVYIATKKPVKIGDAAILRDRNGQGELVTIEYFSKPSTPASSGKITVKDVDGHSHEYYVSILGAEWINREDREDCNHA